MKKRLLVAAFVAGVLALGAVRSTGWMPICAALTDSDPLWYLYGCFWDPPVPIDSNKGS